MKLKELVMKKVLPLICKKYKSPVFRNTEDLNQLKMIKKLSLMALTLESKNEVYI